MKLKKTIPRYEKIRLVFFCLWLGAQVFPNSIGGQDRQFQQVDSLIQYSRSLTSEGQHEAAIELLRRHLDFSWPDQLAIANIHHRIGINYFLLGVSESHFKQAETQFLQAMELRKKAPAEDGELFSSYFMLANLNFNYRNYEGVIRHSEAAARLMEKSTSNRRDYNLGRAYYLLSVGYEESGDQDQALAFGQQALQLFEQLEHKVYRIRCYNQLGLVHNARQEYEKAIEYFQKILALPDLSERHLANAHNNLGLVHEKMTDPKRAIQTYLKAEQINRQIYAQEQTPTRHLAVAGNLENIGIAYTSLKKYAKAEGYLQQAQAIYREERRTDYHPDLAKIYDNLGDLYLEQNKHQQAIEYYHRGVRSLVPDFQSEPVEDNPQHDQHWCHHKPILLTLLRSKANTYLKWHWTVTSNPNPQALQRAYQGYQNIDSLLTKIRQNLPSIEARYALIEQAIPTYEKAIQVALALHDQTQQAEYLEMAYQFCVKNKALIFLEGQQEENARFAGIPPSLLTKEAELQQAYINAETALYDQEIGQLEAPRDSLMRELFQRRREHDQFIQQLEQDYPRYFELKYAYAQKVEIATLLAQLPEGALLVEFFVGQEQLFVFSLSQSKGLTCQVRAIEADFEEKCLLFRRLSAAERLAEDEQQRYHDLARELYLELLAATLENRTETRLLLVPDGPLLQISFDNLYAQAWEIGQPEPYLIRKYAISWAYSSQLFFENNQNHATNTAEAYFAGFGLAYDEQTLDALRAWQRGTEVSLSAQRQVGPLIYSPQEVQEIAKLLGGDFWINERATKSNFLAQAERYQILHLATHGLEVIEKPLNSALAFAKTTVDSDFLLRAADLYPLSLQADLVTLSACDTGHGKLSKGEGIQSLARAFAYAGSPSILASLWSASDASNKEILLPFYQSLKEGKSKDVALQQAKLQYLNENATYARPAYWANLTIIGASTPLPGRSASSWWYFIGIGLLGLGLLFWIYRPRKA